MTTSKSQPLLFMILVIAEVMASTTSSTAASNKKGFDNTTIVDNATFASEKLSAVSKDLSISGSWKYLVDSLERMKRSSENGRSRSRKEHTCDDSPNKNLCLPKSYSKFELPFTDSVNAVEIGIDIIDVLRINDKEYSVTFSFYFNVLWQEPRLHISERFLQELNSTSPETMIPVNLELVNELWLPNIFIYNLKTFKVVEVLSKHAGLWITTNNDVFYSQATHITFICPMRFDSFPLDTQKCKFQVGSYSYDDTKMIFLESPRVKGYVETSRSIVLDYDVKINPLKQNDRILSYGQLGNYSLAGFEMVLHRYVSHYIITYYLPSGLFVVVSWMSFLVPPDVISGRMALLITIFLVLVNIFNSVTSNTPKAEGLTAIEAWMLACILFVFGALVEYAVILFRRQTSKDHVDPPPSRCSHHEPPARRVRIICKDNYKYEMAPPEMRQSLPPHDGNGSQQPQQPLQPQPPSQQQPPQLTETVASITNSGANQGANHHMIQHHTRPVSTMAPHHPNHPHHVQATHGGPAVHLHTGHPHGLIAPAPCPPGMMPPQPLPPLQQPPGPHLFGPPGQLLGSGPGGAYMQGSNFQFEDMPYEEEEVEVRTSNCSTCECGPEFCGENYINVDRFFLVAMPLLFLVFNVVYWFAYGSHYFISTSEEVFITDVD